MESTNEIVKKYDNGDITVLWKPEKCSHAGACVAALPKVYRPKEKPWIKLDEATTAELKSQLITCPSGALSYTMNDENKTTEVKPVDVTIQVRKKGPLLVKGTFEITHADGTIEQRDQATTFCRCGASENKPFCDGTHRNIEFDS